jgi:putative transposase
MKAKYSGMEASDIKRLRGLKGKNQKFKQIKANLSMENRALKEVKKAIEPAKRLLC